MLRRYFGLDRRDQREGMLWQGRWVEPAEMHATAARRCAWFDSQMKSVRNYINDNGNMPTGKLRKRVK